MQNNIIHLACLSGIPLQHLHGEPQVAVIVAVEASVVSSDAPQYSRLIQDLRNGRTVGQLLTIDAATVAMLDGVYMTCSTWYWDNGWSYFTKELPEISSH